mgnify:FL=1
MKKIVITWSASMQDKISYYEKYFSDKWYNVIDTPKPIPENTFFKEYPKVFTDFFENITKTDILFIMNEDKKWVSWYIWPASFSEMCFWVAQNRIYNKNIKIILLKMPEEKVQSYDEFKLWLKLWWIELFDEKLFNN